MDWRSRIHLVSRLPLRLKLGASAATLFFVAALVVVSLIIWRQEVLAKSVAGDAAWAAYKLDRETIQMRNAVLEAERSPGELDDVRMRFELLYSRINLLRHGEIAELFQSLPEARALLPEILSRSDALDAALSRMSTVSPDLASVEERLQALSALSERLVVAVNAYLAESKTREREVQLALYAALLTLILLMCVATVLVVRFLFQEAGENIAARRALEHLSQELKETARHAESANQAKSDFLATVSHEIRTPLNGVLGMTELLRERPLDDASHQYVETIHDSGAQLLSLISDLLDFSKIEAGHLDIERASFSLPVLVEALMRLLEPRAAHVEFTRVISPTLPEHLVGDVGRLRQVLLNLLVNALKFTRQGSVTLLVKPMRGDWVHFEVRDTGCGIDDVDRERLFQPFYQGVPKQGGTGLGLAISKRLVDAMQGRIGVSSRADEGSRFWFELPLPRDAEENKGRHLPSRGAWDATAAGTAPLLVVEDNPVNRQVAVAMLERLGHTVNVADSGEAALALTAEVSFALIFLDVRMPTLDGPETARRILAQDGPNQTTPLIAMTASVTTQEHQRALASGMLDVLTKPIRQQALVDILVHVGVRDPEETPVFDAGAQATMTASAEAMPAVLDRHEFDMLGEALGVAQRSALVAAWQYQSRVLEEALEAAVADADMTRTAELAHRLKGESSSLALTRLVRGSDYLEQAARQADADEAVRQWTLLRPIITSSRQALRMANDMTA
ncbi:MULTISPECIES: ATP-binding protein [Chromohalobacter]|nr:MULTISPECIES: ATP-binding protein [Chromohalobacter]MCI0510152.1 ATP-binding protein [Chromohalobacter sp.]MCI0592480.1 ATP-binding protein [Chromohalobacter sp.]